MLARATTTPLGNRLKPVGQEQPSIICQRKQRMVVEFALRDLSKPIGMATYPLTDTLPAELRPLLPSHEELVRRLDAVAAAWRGWGRAL